MMLKKIKVQEHKGMELTESSPMPYCFPTIYLNDKQIPEMSDWEVGEEYEMVIRVKQRSKHESGDEKKTCVDGSFDVVAYHVPKEKDMDEMTDEEFGEYQSKALNKGSL